MGDEQLVQDLVDQISVAPKYRSVARETIVDVVERELERSPDPRTAAASARKRLHRALQSYIGGPAGRELESLEAAFAAADDGQIRAACEAMMRRHFSSRERLPILDAFYGGLFALTGQPGSIADLACSMNPFALRWMKLPPETEYRAYDFDARTVEKVSRYWDLEGVNGRVEHRDVLCSPPAESVDLVLLLKVYDNLERRRRHAGREILAAVDATWAAVSFPARTMAGRRSNFTEKHLPELVDGEVHGFELAAIRRFESEVLVVLHRG